MAPDEREPARCHPRLLPKAFSLSVSEVNYRKWLLKSSFIYLLGLFLQYLVICVPVEPDSLPAVGAYCLRITLLIRFFLAIWVLKHLADSYLIIKPLGSWQMHLSVSFVS